MSPSTASRSRVPRRMRRSASALVLAGVLTAAAACGGTSEGGTEDAAPAPSSPSPTAAQSPAQPSAESSAPAGEQEVESVEAQLVDFAIELDEDGFAAGTYEFAVANEGDASHDFVVERDGADVAATEVLQPGQSATLTVDLEPGTYTFYCSVGTHRSMGMEVTVEVTA